MRVCLSIISISIIIIILRNYLQGYEELDRPLVSAVDGGDDENDDTHSDHRDVLERVGGGEEQQAVFVPSQHEELEMLMVLSKDAAEILWEMVLVEDGGDGVDLDDMKSRAEQLKAQLRGMLNDYDGSDEVLMCGALEAFDSLNSALNNSSKDAENGKSHTDVPESNESPPPPVPHQEQQQQQQSAVPNLIDF